MRTIRSWLNEDSDEVELVSFCGGESAGFSHSCLSTEKPNEDAAGLFELADDHGILAVADGIGGANCGDRASRCVIEELEKRLVDADKSNSRSCILDAIESANRQILEWGVGAGAALVVAEYYSGTVRTFHVGDATVLLCSNRGRTKFTTVAHAPVAMAVEIGILDELEGMVHEDRNIITNCVGSSEMRIEIGPEISMTSRDTLVLGSDGLFDNLMTDEVAELVCKGDFLAQAGLLVSDTWARMGIQSEGQPGKPDDLTLLCFRQSVTA